MNNIFYKKFILLIFLGQSFVLRAPSWQDNQNIRALMEEEVNARHAVIMQEIPARGGIVVRQIREKPQRYFAGDRVRPLVPKRLGTKPPLSPVGPQLAVVGQQPPLSDRPAPAPYKSNFQPAVNSVRAVNNNLSPLQQCLTVLEDCNTRIARLNEELMRINAVLANPQAIDEDELVQWMGAKSRIEDLDLPQAKDELAMAQLSYGMLIDEEKEKLLHVEAVQRKLLNELEGREARGFVAKKAFISAQALGHAEQLRRKKIEEKHRLAERGLEEKFLGLREANARRNVVAAGHEVGQAYDDYFSLIEQIQQAKKSLAVAKQSKLEFDLLTQYRRLTDLVMADLKRSKDFENWVSGEQHSVLHRVFSENNVSYHFPVWFYQQSAECGCYAAYGLKALVDRIIPAKREIMQDLNLRKRSGLAEWLAPEALNEILEKTMALQRDFSAQQSPAATYSYSSVESGNEKILLIGNPGMVIKQWGEVQFNNPAQPLPTDFPSRYCVTATTQEGRLEAWNGYIRDLQQSRKNYHDWHRQKNSLKNKTAFAIINTNTRGERGHWVAVRWKRRANGELSIICLDSLQRLQLNNPPDEAVLKILRQLGDILVP